MFQSFSDSKLQLVLKTLNLQLTLRTVELLCGLCVTTIPVQVESFTQIKLNYLKTEP